MAIAETEEPVILPPLETPSPLVRYVTSCLLALCVLLGLALVFLACLNPIAVTDFWWQIRTGEIIFRTGSIPHTDPFSWTARGQPWMVHEWLTEVFFYWAFTNLPNWTLLLYKCGLAVVATALVITRGWTRSGSLLLALATGVLAGYAIRNYADLRPQMITFALLAGVLLALDEYRRGTLPRLPWVLPLVFVLWANLHGGVVVGLALVLIWTVGEAAGCWLQRLPSRFLGPLALSLAVCTVAVALNPNGFLVYTYPFQVLGHPQVADYITEWWSPNLHKQAMRPFEVLLLGTFAASAMAGRLPGRVPRHGYGDLLILLAMGHAALITQRNTAPFAIAAAPVLAESLAALWQAGVAAEDSALARWVHGQPISATLSWLRSWPGTRIWAAAGAVAALVMGVRLQIPKVAPSRWFEYGIGYHTFPLQAAARMKRGEWPGALYNDYVYGGYLIWELYPERPVFIDGRAEVYYPTRAFDDEMTIHYASPGWEEALDRRGVQVVLTDKAGSLASVLSYSPRWTRAFDGEVEVVFTRADPASATPAGRSG